MAHSHKGSVSVKRASAVDVYNLPLVEYWLVIDARSTAAWTAGHIATAWSLPPQQAAGGGAAAQAFARLWEVVYEENPPESTRTVVVYGDGSTGTASAAWADAICAALVDPPTASKLRLQQVLLLDGGYAGFASSFPFLTRETPAAGGEGSSALPCVLDEAESLDFLPASITPQLFLGSDAHAQSRTCFTRPPHGLGVTHVVNAARECPNYFDRPPAKDEVGAASDARAAAPGPSTGAGAGGAGAGSGVASDATAASGAACGPVTYLRLDWEDTERQELGDKLQQAVKFISAAHAHKQKVLVHCHRGRSRSASVVVAFLMITRRWRLSRALDHVVRCRGVAEPNGGFLRQLEELDHGMST